MYLKKRKCEKSTCILACLCMLFVLTDAGTGSEDLTALCVVNVDSEGRALLLNNMQTCTLSKQIQDLDRGSKKVTTFARGQDKQH